MRVILGFMDIEIRGGEFSVRDELFELTEESLSEIDHAVTEAPFIVIPAENLKHMAAHYFCVLSVNNGTVWISDVIRAHEWSCLEAKNALHGTLRRSLEAAFTASDVTSAFVSKTMSTRNVRRRDSASHAV